MTSEATEVFGPVKVVLADANVLYSRVLLDYLVIHDLRTGAGLSQRELAERMKVSTAIWCRSVMDSPKLMVVDIALSRDQDNPQLIFESMNSTGRELSQADLIRNFLLMGQQPKQQAALYKDYWRPMEMAFGQEAYGLHFDGFMRHFLTLRTGEVPRIRDVNEAFKSHSRSPMSLSAASMHLWRISTHSPATTAPGPSAARPTSSCPRHSPTSGS